MGFREHGVMLYLDRTLYKAFIKLQADQELGRSYAGLLPFVEGLYTMGYLDKEDYVEHRQKYSEKLVADKVVQMPKCRFCDSVSVSLFEDTATKIQQYVCSHHAEQFAESEKWVKVK